MRSIPAERRRTPRIYLQIPVFVRGQDHLGREVFEFSRAMDISSTGALLAVPAKFKDEQLLTLTVPAPPPSASGLIPAETPPFQARVRRQQPSGDLHLVGVEFLRRLD